ncbi:MAG: archaellin/type IV pilin N-terminal domain-containing protein [Nanoarchaeota archaeon]
MRNKRGLSTIVATLIIILLTLVAVGIIWVVIRNVIQGGAENIDLSAKCIAVSLEAVSVTETSGVYAVTLKRNAGGEALGGIKVSIFNATSNSGVIDFGALTELQTSTVSLPPSGTTVTSGNKIEYTPFFLDSSGNEQLCSQTQTFNF